MVAPLEGLVGEPLGLEVVTRFGFEDGLFGLVPLDGLGAVGLDVCAVALGVKRGVLGKASKVMFKYSVEVSGRL